MGEPAVKPAKAPEEKAAASKTAVAKPAERRRTWPALRDMAFDRFFEDLFEDFDRGFRWPMRLRRRFEPILAEAPRMAKVDVFQTDGDVVVKAEIPGVSKDQIEVTVTDDTVTVKAEKKHEEEVKEEDYYRSERTFGTVQRTVELPVEVKADKATAKMSDGVLEVRIPKTEAAKAGVVKIDVQ